MEAQNLPQTSKELASWMKARCYNFDRYSIGGNSICEGFGLEKAGSSYLWYYTERGQRTEVVSFTTEQEAVAHAYQQIVADKWATAHYVGLTDNQAEAQELAGRLGSLGIAFWQDELANFYALQRPAYRTFVSGCDINRAEFLKRQFYHKS